MIAPPFGTEYVQLARVGPAPLFFVWKWYEIFMISELKTLFDYYEKEKGIDRNKMVEALSQALLAASKKSIGPARELRIDIDPDKGTIKAFAKLLAVETVTNRWEELPLATAKRFKKDAVIGDAFDRRERQVLALTDAMTRDVTVPDALMADLQQHYDAQHLVELVATVAAYNMVSRFLVALNVSH